MTIKRLDDKVSESGSDELQAHYSFDYQKAKPNRFAEPLSRESVMVVLDPDVALIFPTTQAVNEALRVLAAALEHLPKPKAIRKRKARIPLQQAA